MYKAKSDTNLIYNLKHKTSDLFYRSFSPRSSSIYDKIPYVSIILFILAIALKTIHKLNDDPNYIQNIILGSDDNLKTYINPASAFFLNYLDLMGVNSFLDNMSVGIIYILISYPLLMIIEMNIGHVHIAYFIIVLILYSSFATNFQQLVCKPTATLTQTPSTKLTTTKPTSTTTTTKPTTTKPTTTTTTKPTPTTTTTKPTPTTTPTTTTPTPTSTLVNFGLVKLHYCCGSFIVFSAIGFVLAILFSYSHGWKMKSIMCFIILIMWGGIILCEYFVTFANDTDDIRTCLSFFWNGMNFLFGVLSGIVMVK